MSGHCGFVRFGGGQRMLKRLSGIGLLVALGWGCPGCRIEGISFSAYDHHPPVRVRRVHVDVSHVCTRDCRSHYWNGNRVVVLNEHRHGPHCGHLWSGTHWVVRKARIRAVHYDHGAGHVTHVHGPSCGHVYHPRSHRWIVVGKSHRHHRGCGHYFADARWSIRVH